MPNYYKYHTDYLEDLEIDREREESEDFRAMFRDYAESTGDSNYDNFSLSGLKL